MNSRSHGKVLEKMGILNSRECEVQMKEAKITGYKGLSDWFSLKLKSGGKIMIFRISSQTLYQSVVNGTKDLYYILGRNILDMGPELGQY